MRFLSHLEARLDGALKRLFPKRSGEGVQPVEVARRLAKEMERERRLSVHAVYVPNAFRVRLHPGDYERIEPVVRTVVRDVKAFLGEVAERRGFAFAGPLEVMLSADEETAPGQMLVETAFKEAPEAEDDAPRGQNGAARRHVEERGLETIAYDRAAFGGGDAGSLAGGRSRSLPGASDSEHTKAFRPEAGAALAVEWGPDAGRTWELEAARPWVVGRAAECDIALTDRRVSRRHALFRFDGESWWVEDLGSANGTYRNGERIERVRLRRGDGVTVGMTTLRFQGHAGA